MTLYAQQDLSAYVLTLLDDHIAAMQSIRERMRIGSTTSPGARHTVAQESIAIAETYAATMSGALTRHRTYPDQERLL